MVLPGDFKSLIDQANALRVYDKLIVQLNKDLRLANMDLNFSEDIIPLDLKLSLQDALCHVMQNRFHEYLNLLYVIDVSEKKIKALDASDLVALSEAVTFLILQREWQKVWYKLKYS